MRRTAFILFAVTLVARLITLPFMEIPYDEAAYAWTANNLATKGGWLDLYGSDDLFFFPPLYNYLAALAIKLGIDRLSAVRAVTILFSSTIPPLIYLLAVRSGLSTRPALIAVALWFFLPWGWHLSVVGMVETPWIACFLAALLFAHRAREEGHARDVVISAILFLAGLWIKETILGTVPLFLWTLWPRRRIAVVWSAIAFLGFLPLAAQSFLPHQYDLFYEITTPLILWNNFSLDPLIANWGVIQGTALAPWQGWGNAFSVFTLVVLTLAIRSVPREEWRRNFILQMAAGFLLIYVPFFILFPKKFPYYLLPVYLFAAFFIGRYLADRHRFAAFYGALVLLFAVPTLVRLSDRTEENDYREAFSIVAREKPDARIGLTLPRKAEYLAEKGGITLTLDPTDWLHCTGRAEECLYRNDYLMSDNMFLLMLFCRHWPMGPETCDMAAYAAAKERLTPLYRGQEFTLYRIEKPVAAP